MYITAKIAKRAIFNFLIVLLLVPNIAVAHQETDVLGAFILGTIIGKELSDRVPPKVIILPNNQPKNYNRELEPVYEIVTEYSRGCDCIVSRRQQIGWKYVQ